MKFLIMAVCALNFYLPNCTATKASGAVQPDGAISVLAVDENIPTVKYNLGSDFNYATQGQLSGSFTGLVPGTYQVYARSSSTCRKVINIIVGVNDNYQVRHRLFFNMIGETQTANKTWRLDIEDNEFVGALVEEYGSDGPVIDSWRGEGNQDIFTPVISRQLDVTLISQSDAYFHHLFTYDERRFRGRLYKWNGSTYVLDFVGFLLPMVYSESYVDKENYEVNCTFTDGLADLKDYTFSDDSANFPTTRISFFNAILYCLHKTEVNLEVWESVNITNELMGDGDEDSCLTQAFIDMSVYMSSDGEVSDCLTVLSSLLNNFKSRIYQSAGVWHISLITESPSSEVITRKYEFDGTYIQTDTEEPRILLRRPGTLGQKISLSDRSANIQILQNYGAYELTYNLGIEDENNLLESGTFEDEDVENGQLKGWQVTTDGSFEGQYEYGLEELTPKRGNSEFAFYSQFKNIGTNAVRNIKLLLSSSPFVLSFPEGGCTLRLRFDIYTRPLYTEPYIYIDFSLIVAGFSPFKLQAKEIYTDENGNSVMRQLSAELVDSNYIRVYIDQHLSWKTIEVDVGVNNFSNAGEYQLTLRVSSNPKYDLGDPLTDLDFSSLKLTSTTGEDVRTFYNRRKVIDPNGSIFSYNWLIREYSLEPGSDTEEIPSVIRPDDYDSSQPFVWKLGKTFKNPIVLINGIQYPVADWLQNILIDNVKIEYYPQGGPPIKEVVKTEVFNQKIKQVLPDEIFHGDIDYSAGMDDNFTLISRSYISDVNGLQFTGGWRRRSEPTASDLLTNLLVKMVKGQYNQQRVLLTGSIDNREIVPSFHNSIYEVRSGRVYSPISISRDLRNNSCELELIETLKGEPVIDEGDPVLPDIEPPVNIREFTDEFSPEFT